MSKKTWIPKRRPFFNTGIGLCGGHPDGEHRVVPHPNPRRRKPVDAAYVLHLGFVSVLGTHALFALLVACHVAMLALPTDSFLCARTLILCSMLGTKMFKVQTLYDLAGEENELLLIQETDAEAKDALLIGEGSAIISEE